MIQFKLLHPNAVLPTRATTHAAGFDMTAPESVVIPAGQSYWIPSGVAMAIPEGSVGLVWPRSGLAYKHSVDTLGGVIDSDYRGEVKIGLINHGLDPIEIRQGDRICQLVVQSFVRESCMVNELPDPNSNRTGGFGSTGVGTRQLPEPPQTIPMTQEDVQYYWGTKNS